ncbi:MAG TPA: hypothetical protein VLL97_07395 [Acidobacteriota bacterium]|nr:hypothetical protein [Acidobacteriota bacterium]
MFVVSFIHLKCALSGCSGYFIVPIITSSDACIRSIIKVYHSWAREIIEHFWFEEHNARLDKADLLKGGCRGRGTVRGRFSDISENAGDAAQEAAYEEDEAHPETT